MSVLRGARGCRGRGAGGGGSLTPVSTDTPSIAFRHLPPKEGCRKPVPGVWPVSVPSDVIRFGLALKGVSVTGKQKDLGSIPLRLSFFFKKVVVCGHCLVTLSLTINETVKTALVAAHLNAGVILVVTV